MNETPNNSSINEAIDSLTGAFEPLVELVADIAESASEGFAGLADSVAEALESIQRSPAWLDLFGEPTAECVDHVSAQITLEALDGYSSRPTIASGGTDTYIENRPTGTRASDVYEHLFDNLQERFRIAELGGGTRQIYSIDCLGNTHDHHVGGSEHSHRDPGDDARVLNNLELFETELGVTDIIGLHGQSYLSPLVDDYNDVTGGRGINYHDFTLGNFSQRDDNEERDETIRGNYELFGTAHYLAHNAPGNVMTHCRHGRHRARTVWLVVRVVDHPPQLEFTSTYEGTPRYNELNDTDRERLDVYIKDQMEAIGIPEEEFGYLREAGDLLGQVGDIALSEEYRGDILNASNSTTY